MAMIYPAGKYEPLGTQTEPLMKSHDILCFHTMVGSLAGTSNMFHQNGYGGTESHFGVGEAGEVEQWQDLRYQADANLDGGHRVVSIETADYGGVFGKWDTKDPNDVPPWTGKQLDRLVDMTVWFCRKETHAKCPSTWKCHQVGVPCVLIPDTKPGRRGLGYHKQGCDPYRVDGGEKWSSAYGKVCPAPARIKQLTTIVIPRAQKILAAGQEDEMTPEQEKKILDYLAAVSVQVQANTRQNVQAAVQLLKSEIDEVDDEVWNRQIADVSTPEVDTAAAATLLTHAANRAAQEAVELLQPQLTDILQRLQRIEDDTDDGTA